MVIKIAHDVLDYMKKQESDFLIITMDLNVTNPGCGCGVSKKFYVPSVQLGFNKEEAKKLYSSLLVDNMEVFYPKWLKVSDQTVNIFLEKTLWNKNLIIEGLDTILE